jgi:hypothetical protein
MTRETALSAADELEAWRASLDSGTRSGDVAGDWVDSAMRRLIADVATAGPRLVGKIVA